MRFMSPGVEVVRTTLGRHLNRFGDQHSPDIKRTRDEKGDEISRILAFPSLSHDDSVVPPSFSQRDTASSCNSASARFMKALRFIQKPATIRPNITTTAN